MHFKLKKIQHIRYCNKRIDNSGVYQFLQTAALVFHFVMLTFPCTVHGAGY